MISQTSVNTAGSLGGRTKKPIDVTGKHASEWNLLVLAKLEQNHTIVS